uniref:Ion transport domain-containing protein n=2 Tax=Clytia hemisphaerica TaxID=252671 RepID=A0A7M5V028_9CNID
DLCEIYVRDYYPDHLYAPTDPQMQEISVEDGNRKNAYKGPKVPFELAYEKHHDKTAAFLAGEMKPFRLRQLFERRDDGVLQCSFAEVINNDMQLTAIKVLDSCMNPDWPYVPVNPLEEDDETLCKLKDDPTSYHFYYHILDSDQSGRAPKKPVESEAEKDRFNHIESSPFQLLVTNKVTKQAAISHPTVRGLVNRKWEHFGETRVKVFLGFYILFLLMLALGLFFSEDWGSNVDIVIKLIVVIFNIVYTFEEIDQMTKEGRDYLAWTNLFDLLGILTIYALIPLYAFGEYKIYYGVASAAFILNFFRVLKFFATFEVGNYARVFMFLLKEDVWVFLQFFAVLMVAFTGAVFLALKSEMSNGGKIIDGQNETLTIWSTMLREARALAEGKEFADDYDGVYTAPLIIFLLLNMAAIIVVLSNILIGQISARYEDAAKDAKVQSDIAKAKVICKIEKSRFVWRNLRIKYYTPGDYVTDEGLVKERLSEWYELKKESDSSRDAIKKLQEGLKKSDPVPVESRVKEIQTELQATKKLLEKLLKRLPAD